MTPEQLDEIEKLAEAATPGPYQVASIYPAYGVFRVQVNEPSECVAMCAVSVNEDADEPHVERQAAHTRNGTNAKAIATLLQHALPLVKAVRQAWQDREDYRNDAIAAEQECDRMLTSTALLTYLVEELVKAPRNGNRIEKLVEQSRTHLLRLREYEGSDE